MDDPDPDDELLDEEPPPPPPPPPPLDEDDELLEEDEDEDELLDELELELELELDEDELELDEELVLELELELEDELVEPSGPVGLLLSQAINRLVPASATPPDSSLKNSRRSRRRSSAGPVTAGFSTLSMGRTSLASPWTEQSPCRAQRGGSAPPT